MSFYRGILIYVGKGSGDRWRHTITGGSSSELLNDFYFRNKYFNDMPIETHIVKWFNTSEQASKNEKVMINKHKPLCNKCTGRVHKTDNSLLSKIYEVSKNLGYSDPEYLESKFDFKFLFTPKGLLCKKVELCENSPFEYTGQDYHVKLKPTLYVHFPEYSLQYIEMPDNINSEMFHSFTSKRLLLNDCEIGLSNNLRTVSDNLDWLVSAYGGESFCWSDEMFKNPHMFNEEAFRSNFEKGRFNE